MQESYRAFKKRLEPGCNWVYSPNMLGKNGGTIGHKIGTKLPTGGNRAARKQACYLQQVTYDTALQLKETFDNTKDAEERARLAASITNSVKAWDMTRERIRILDGDPMPGSLRPIAKPKKVRSISTKPLWK